MTAAPTFTVEVLGPVPPELYEPNVVYLTVAEDARIRAGRVTAYATRSRAEAAVRTYPTLRLRVLRLDLSGVFPEAEAWGLPLHRTEAGYPCCSTCDGGGCLDCTDPS